MLKQFLTTITLLDHKMHLTGMVAPAAVNCDSRVMEVQWFCVFCGDPLPAGGLFQVFSRFNFHIRQIPRIESVRFVAFLSVLSNHRESRVWEFGTRVFVVVRVWDFLASYLPPGDSCWQSVAKWGLTRR